MNRNFVAILAVIALLLSVFGVYEFIMSGKKDVDNGGGTPAGKTVTFDITAKRFQFDPAEIIVEKGDDVTINITSLDATHGFAITELGINETIPQGETRQVRFIADKTGSYKFFCSIPCGPGHNEMKGNLIIGEPIPVVIPGNTGDTLDLSGKGLVRFPPEVLKMTELISLDISGNKLTGALPGEIRFLRKLKKLDVSDNLMTGIPAEIGQLSELEELDYSNNSITGLPNEIKNLKKLRIFNLSGNDYSRMDLAQIKAELLNLTVIGE